MSLLTLLQLENEQIETVIGAVRDWCVQNGRDLTDGEARKAMTIAITLAIATNPTRTELLESLSRTVESDESWASKLPEVPRLQPRSAFAPEDITLIRQLLREWCDKTEVERSSEEAMEAARKLAAWFQRGASVRQLRQLLDLQSDSKVEILEIKRRG